MNETIKQIFNKIDIKTIIATLYLFTIAFVAIPKPILEELKLLDFKTNYQFIISLTFIVLSCYYIISVVNWLGKKIKNIRLIKIRKQILEKISDEEKGYLMKFYDLKNKRLGPSCTFDMTDGTVALLESRQIISRASSISKGLTNFSYILQPWAFEIINRKILSNEIEIKEHKKSKNKGYGCYPYDQLEEEIEYEYIWK